MKYLLLLFSSIQGPPLTSTSVGVLIGCLSRTSKRLESRTESKQGVGRGGERTDTQRGVGVDQSRVYELWFYELRRLTFCFCFVFFVGGRRDVKEGEDSTT